MSRIFGLIAPELPAPAVLQKCLDTMGHYRSSATDFYMDTEADLKSCMGILAPDAARQILSVPDRKVAAVLDGTISNSADLRAELQKKGAIFQSTSDSEVLLWGFYYEGELFFRKMCGQYAAAIRDRRGTHDRVLLLRDRLGVKPLHYFETADRIAFASELKAICRLPGIKLEINTAALDHYLVLRYIPSPLTIWSNIRKVAPGEYVVFENGQCRRKYYYRITVPEKKFNGSLNEAVEELDHLLNNVVKEQLESNTPQGAFLSGGIDSSLICAIVQKQLGTVPLKTFTIGFENTPHDESSYAAEIARYLGSEHICQQMTRQDLLARLPELAELYDEPYGDDSALPSCLLAALAEQEVSGVFSGDGGDELFFGYPNLAANWNMAKVYGTLPRIPRKICGKLLHKIFGESLPGRLGRAISYDRMDQIYTRTSGFFSNHLLEKLCGRTLQGKDSIVFQKCSLLENENIPAEYLTPYLDMALYMPDDVCCKVDRANMAYGLDVRAPLLDHRIVEFANCLPFHYKYDPQTGGKIVLKKVLEKYIPRPLWDRPKCGFSSPVTHWMKHDLQQLVKDMLAPKKIQQKWGFSPEQIRALHTRQAGTYNNDILLWILFCLENWHLNLKK